MRKRILIAGLLVSGSLLSGRAAAQTTYYVNALGATNVGWDGTTNMTTLADLSVTGGSSNQNRAYTNNTAPTGTVRWRVREGAADTRAGQEFFRAYTPTYGAATNIAANATAYADFYMNGTGTSVVAKATIYEYNDSTGIVGAAKGTASFTGNAGISTRQTMNNVSFANAQFTVSAGNRILVIYSFDMNASRPAYLWGQSASATPSGYQSFTVTESASATTTVGSGTDPGNASLCPGGAATMLDAFTLQTSSGADTVTAITVTLAAGTSAGLSLIEITNDAGTTVYGSVTNPVVDTPAIGLTTSITATTTLTQYKVRVAPKSHANMSLPPGTTSAVTGTVTAIASTNGKAYNDSASATVTIDNLSPGNPTAFNGTSGSGQVSLSWVNPADADLNQVVVLRSTAAIADVPAEGATYAVGNTIGASTVACVVNAPGTSCIASGLVDGTPYYFKAFAKDTCGNYSSGGVTAGPYTPSGPSPVLTGAPSATVNACNQITVSAPFTGDLNGNSTTAISRGTSSTGPWTAVCSNLTGASPRLCVDNGVVASTTYFYQVTFADADGVTGANPQVIGGYPTPVCTAPNGTTAGTATALVTGCKQIFVSAPFTGDGNANGSVLVEYNTTNTWPGTTACAAVTGPSPRTCLITGLPASTAYYVRVTYTDPDGVTGTNPQVLAGTYTTTACSGNGTPPMIMFVSPAKNAVLGGTERFKVQVFDPDGVNAASVQCSLNGGAYGATTKSTKYACNPASANCAIYEFDVSTTTLPNGANSVTVRAADTAATPVTGYASLGFRVNNVGAAAGGAGNLLRRSHGSQLCSDCHNIQTHSSQTTSFKYGSWAQECLSCHAPHLTKNIYLVREQLATPSSGTFTVVFQQDDKVGSTNPQNSYLGAYTVDANATPTTDGVCETCHTKTNHYRRDTSGGDHTHNQANRCVDCHDHGSGFYAVESTGCLVNVAWTNCSKCHSSIWQGMTGTKASKHTLGAAVGLNDNCSDTAVTWGPVLNTNAAVARSCVNMCHTDHVHNLPGQTTHGNNVHLDARTNTSRSVTRDAAGNITAAATAGSPAKTDFDGTFGWGGMCLSCHQYPIESGATPAHPAITQAPYTASAHNYTNFSTYGAWQYTQHDGSTFDRNCTKCHADRADARPGDASTPFGAVHFSDYPSLLAGSTNPNAAPATFVCYNCHGNGTTGTNLSGKNIASQVAKAGSQHPADSDNVHSSVTEANGAAFGNTLGVTGRHVNCQDCHEPHKAKSGTHATPGNLAGPPLEGAWGAQLSTNPAFWTAPANADFTKKTIVAGTDVEATLCFKCHSNFYGTLPTSPSGGFTETNTAMEFNPNNVGNFAGTWANTETAGSFHPVLANAGSNLGAVRLTNLVTTNLPWSTTTRNLMTCSDCHESETTTDPNGPHGSTAKFILKGPNTAWDNTITNGSTMPAAVFCANCHPTSWTNSRFPDHSRNNHFVACFNCHSAIPHGGPRPGFLTAGAGANANVGGVIAGWDQTSPYWQGGATNRLYLVSYPTNNTTNWQQSNCGCNGTGH